MEIKQNPFSFYDFLGYFVPGALFLYALIIEANWAAPNASFALSVTSKFNLDPTEYYLFFVLGAYVIGHLLSYISSVTIEKYSVWNLGYPSNYLLGLPCPKYFSVDTPKLVQIMFRVLLAIFLGPISLIDLLYGTFSHNKKLYAKSLDPTLIKILREKVAELFHDKAGLTSENIAKETNFFRLVYHYTVENAPAHLPRMHNYIALYGFCRTLTLAAILLFWFNLIEFFLGRISPQYALMYLPVLGILAFILFLDFMKFYRRFSLEVLLTLAVVYPTDKKKQHQEKA
jgi:hypothetical protein